MVPDGPVTRVPAENQDVLTPGDTNSVPALGLSQAISEKFATFLCRYYHTCVSSISFSSYNNTVNHVMLFWDNTVYSDRWALKFWRNLQPTSLLLT